MPENEYLGGIAILIIVIGLCLWGAWAARRHERWQFAERNRRFNMACRTVDSTWLEIKKLQEVG